jgi:hypothetical protein
VGICVFIMGRQRAGKDTAADYLVEHYGFEKGQLARPVYEIARQVFGMQGKDRGLLIQIGVKMREIDPLVFPKALWRRALGVEAQAEVDAGKAALPADMRLVITDARFANEWDFFKSRGGVALRIKASQQVRSQRSGYHLEYENDPTETQLDTAAADYVITNEGSLADCYAALDEFMGRLLA